ncbi:MAG: heavy-metal-associated domain-containing protein [Flavobacteriales bacterium]|nr:heavy-metal-associated domain-containing protein [Flavobacteriales bacterium]
MRIISACIALLFGLALSAQETAAPSAGKTAHLDIQSSTVCDMCVKTIEEELIYEKGVKSVHVDLDESKVHIEYDPRKNNADALRAALIKLGYAADGVPGDPVAFKKLPACCQKEGCGTLPGTQGR